MGEDCIRFVSSECERGCDGGKGDDRKLESMGGEGALPGAREAIFVVDLAIRIFYSGL